MAAAKLTIGSCFAGIGGFDVGFERAGFQVAWHAEKDPNCRKLLASKWPNAIPFDDVHQVTRASAPPVDVICGGFPCQDLSIAGKRAGLRGDRSGLFYQLTRITHELQPAFLIWENVPGLLSSNNGHDFLAVLIELRRIGFDGGWRTFDAHYFGLAQRRRRVFGVFARRDIGAASCAEILSLAEGMRGHPAPGKGARKRLAGTITPSALDGSGACGGDGREGMLVAGTLNARNRGGGGLGTDFEIDGGLQIAMPLLSHHKRSDHETETLIAFNARQDPDVSGDISGPLQTDGGTQAFAFDTTQITNPKNRCHPKPGDPCHPLATGAHPPAIIFKPSHYTRDKDGAPSEVSPPLSADADKGDREPVIFQSRIAWNGRGQPEDKAPALNGSNAGATSDVRPLVSASFGVRRLTPLECERLQGFVDTHTFGFSDSVRYRMLGNAVAVPCAEWLGRRTARVLLTLAIEAAR